MTAVAQKTVLTGCLAPIDRGGLEQLIANGKANPKVIKPLKCKTVIKGKFRHADYIRNLAPYIVDEPPGSSRRRHRAKSVRRPRSPRSAPALQSACTPTPCIAAWIVNKLELELEGDLNIPSVWGTGLLSENRSILQICASKSTWNARAFPRARSTRWSPTSRNGPRSPTPLPARQSRGRISPNARAQQGCGRRSWVH